VQIEFNYWTYYSVVKVYIVRLVLSGQRILCSADNSAIIVCWLS